MDNPVTVKFSVRMTSTDNVGKDVHDALAFLAQKYIEAKQDWQTMIKNPAIEVNVERDWYQPTLWETL